MKPSLAPALSPAPVVAFLASLFLALTAAGVAAPAWAERADRDKPTNIEADHLVHDQAKRTSRFRGQVILTKGTLQIRADDLEVIEDDAGFQSASALGKPVRFRQKLEGRNEFIEGQSLRLNYDGRNEVVRLQQQAEVRRMVDGKSADLMQGDLIVYDARSDQYEVNRGAPGSAPGPTAENPTGRVRVVIQPKAPPPSR
ncbi:MAG: lipopolysaccharide transport periplasmic protein LptA [Betaproteobacteria bacterium]|nr:lipopolysaccharide transport periplasmic protein LptA [Betaproteobacteria bacterium]